MKMKAVIPVSGGIDSSTCVAYASSLGYEVYAMFVNYQQNNFRHELEVSKSIASYYNIQEMKILNFDWFKQIGNTSLTDGTHINLENKGLEYVPFRNSIILSIAMAWAEAIEADAIFYGSTGAPWITPDNSPEFYDAFRKLASIGAQKKDIEIFAPFNEWKKSQVVELGTRLGVPYHLTWSCHNDGDSPCMECSQCLDRKRGFLENGLEVL